MGLLPVRSILFWFSASAAALPVLLALVSAIYYWAKQIGIQKKLRTKNDLASREWRKILAELSDYGQEDRVFKKLLGNEMVSVQDYINIRVDPTIVGYNSKASAYAAFYTCLVILQIIYAAMIPLVLLVTDNANGNAKLVGAVLGAAVTVACTVNATCKLRERWYQYLGLRDKLFAERSLYMASGVYKKDLWRRKDGNDYNFVELCENIIALEYRNLADNVDNSDVLGAEPIESVAPPNGERVLGVQGK